MERFSTKVFFGLWVVLVLFCVSVLSLVSLVMTGIGRSLGGFHLSLDVSWRWGFCSVAVRSLFLW